ncbi:Rho GTPase-activating domain-containing protein [Chloropicon primus]|uniref:Rho GTPase-activating domain-containing protein n=1 Tax=Chloropicon primus TaxID=1764295 RepID=A0A5B8MHZ4_9CHLO|nr:Rho GTPase-activating domain-containing protein [Chloropicon primus]UPQ98198.1 Rho GTPase-activating domain-containing protein [Chloropicon primus]|eukprot:QDZ18990.1 Rho GTPase-activating domain-containing protein [Chloropicon primus]
MPTRVALPQRDDKSVFQVPLSELYARGNGAAPQVLVDIIRKLDKSKVHADRVFKGPINENLVEMFKGLYDDGHRRPLSRCFEVYTVAGLLKSFLMELPKPLFTEELVRALVDKVDASDAEGSMIEIQKLVPKISICERRTLRYIMFYLNRSCQQKSVCLTNSSRRSVARIFVPILFKAGHDGDDMSANTKKLEKSLELMIERCEQVFSPFPASLDLGGSSPMGSRSARAVEPTAAGNEEASVVAEEAGIRVESMIADTVDSLFAAPTTTLDTLRRLEAATEERPVSKQHQSRPNTKKGVLREFSLNVVEQKNPGVLEKEQRIVKPATKANFANHHNQTTTNFDDMTFQQLFKEKKKIKKKIRNADYKLAIELGRKPTQVEKEPLRPMYSRYWRIKRALDGKNEKSNGSGNEGARSNQVLELLKF